MKIRIANEEVLASNDFTINQEMLNTPSVILNNVYPKSWEQDKDYVSRFYHPDDYSQCQIVEDYEALPGENIEGTNFQINVDNTLQSNITHLKGQTTQNGTPTPDTPIPIETTTGNQEIVVCGKNLYDYNTYPVSTTNHGITITNNGDGTFTLNGTSDTNNWSFALGSNAEIKKYSQTLGLALTQTAYYVSGTCTKVSTSNSRNVIRLDYNHNASFIHLEQLNSSNPIISKTLPSRPTSTYFSYNINFGLGDIFNNFTIRYQLEIGSQATSYEPYISKTTSINLGKNLFDKTNYPMEQGTFNYNTNANQTSNNRIRSPYFAIQPNTTYTLSCNEEIGEFAVIYKQSDASTIIAGMGENTTNKYYTFTTPSNAYFMRFRIGSATYVKTYTTDYEIQIERGNKATSYSPYFTPIELCKIGDYQDKIAKSTGKNLFDYQNVNNLAIGNGVIIESSNYRGYTIPNANGKTYTISRKNTTENNRFRIAFTIEEPANNVAFYDASGTHSSINADSLTETTFTVPSNYNYAFIYLSNNGETIDESLEIQIEKGTQATSYEPYGKVWYIEKKIGKVVLDGSEVWAYNSSTNSMRHSIGGNLINNGIITTACSHFIGVPFIKRNEGTYPKCYFENNYIQLKQSGYTDVGTFKNWLATAKPILYYILATPTYTEITNETLINELESLELLYGINNISVNGYLPGILGIHYNWRDYYEDLIFCGVVKNSGNISLNPRYPHYSTLQILDYKTFLSEGETLDFVIANKTILEAINEVIARISDYGFELGNVSILNSNEVIGAYSTKDKTAYDVFNYIADITQSRWTTRVLGVGRVAIDFYDPSLMPQGTGIEYNDTWFCQNKIIDMTYNYGTWNYRNKQVMTSNQVFGSIEQTQTIIYDGYANQLMTELPIGTISSITVDGVSTIIATNNEKAIGITADFYYTPGNNYFEKSMGISVGSQIIITYYPLVEGRQIVNNGVEIDRVSQATGTIGKISRYENRNDATTSLELQKIGQSYIKYKGTPEIKLTIKSGNNVWNVGDRVYFNAPITELKTEYMVRSKKTNYIYTANTIFYTFELISSFNSENEVNYFDNQRAKANGNIKEGQYISRNIDIEGQANIIFYDTEVDEVVANNTLQSELEMVLGG